ncbi:hypothetical protein [Bradyrhizobium guangdongense]|uniref:hypothetical protein n=1 Tax=Bradyrhizobium guangdongense TaxID=1325090 RepID=UPI001FEE2D23|nr:hypothetical protein [Bradyrhizobium guangdongense]
MKARAFLIGVLMAGGIGISNAATAAPPAAPPAGYAIAEKHTKTSPDGATTIEQYLNQETDEWKWLFWARRAGTFALLDPEPAGYAAAFVFTNDQNWIVRLQKTGSGEQSLYLYRFTPQGYVSATKKPLGDLAWAYMKSRPDWRKIVKAPEYHEAAYLWEGFEDNYRKLGVDWPANRYLVIGLSGDADVKRRKRSQTAVVNGWHCRYDLQTGKFDVPPSFARDNAKAVVPE